MARNDAPPQTFDNGFYKPPVDSDDYERLGTTGWWHWTMDGVSMETTPPPPTRKAYSTSVFYDGVYTKRFLFHPADCQTMNISTIENREGGWGWQQLCFTERDIRHSVLDLNGEYDSLCGKAGSYSPFLLPPSYQSRENNAECGLSGNMSLLLALAAFSCNPNLMLAAISQRLKLRERRWDNGQVHYWGNGRKVFSRQVRVRH